MSVYYIQILVLILLVMGIVALIRRVRKHESIQSNEVYDEASNLSRVSGKNCNVIPDTPGQSLQINTTFNSSDFGESISETESGEGAIAGTTELDIQTQEKKENNVSDVVPDNDGKSVLDSLRNEERAGEAKSSRDEDFSGRHDMNFPLVDNMQVASVLQGREYDSDLGDQESGQVEPEVFDDRSESNDSLSGDFEEPDYPAVANKEEPNGVFEQDKKSLVSRSNLKESIRSKKKGSPKYLGLNRAAPQPKVDGQQSQLHTTRSEAALRSRSLPIEVRLRFDRGGFCQISLIAKRSECLPEDISVATGSGELGLRAMTDEWYQDIEPGDLAKALSEGVMWTLAGENVESNWVLSGRELFVLSARSDVSGFISKPCLDIGREHIVLCTESVRDRVRELLLEADANIEDVLDRIDGVPRGWMLFRHVVPQKAIPPIEKADIFNALRPLPNLEISFEDGIKLEYSNWLENYPPQIYIYGDQEHIADVRIDGKKAIRTKDGSYQIEDWDAVGSHTVWCAGITKSYSIMPFEGSWEFWHAYTFPVEFQSEQSLCICGPMVCAGSETTSSPRFLVSIPETNPVLLGSEPGQVVKAVRVSELRGGFYVASPAFRPVWALPKDPLHCDKNKLRILLVGEKTPLNEICHSEIQACCRSGNIDIELWCKLILDASRKGLITEPGGDDVQLLWRSYKRIAHRVRRAKK